MRPSVVVVRGEGPKDPLQMAPVEDQHPVRELGPNRADPPLGEVIRSRRSDWGLDDLVRVPAETRRPSPRVPDRDLIGKRRPVPLSPPLPIPSHGGPPPPPQTDGPSPSRSADSAPRTVLDPSSRPDHGVHGGRVANHPLGSPALRENSERRPAARNGPAGAPRKTGKRWVTTWSSRDRTR
jgi:hypothetical protein